MNKEETNRWCKAIEVFNSINWVEFINTYLEIEKENTNLKQQLKQRNEVIDEAIKLLEYGGIDSYTDSIEKIHEFRDKAVNILQKYKEANNEN